MAFVRHRSGCRRVHRNLPMIKRKPFKKSGGRIQQNGHPLPKKRLKRLLGGKKKGKTASAKLKELKLAWCIPTTNNFKLRYSGLRGVYWYWLSRQVRKDEWIKWDGKCITCDVPLATWEEGQCGHVVPSRMCGEYLRLNPINLTLQHAKCNNPRFRPDAGALNAIHFDKRHGQGAFQELYDMKKIEAKEPSQEEYRTLIRSLPSFQEALNSAPQATIRV